MSMPWFGSRPQRTTLRNREKPGILTLEDRIMPSVARPTLRAAGAAAADVIAIRGSFVAGTLDIQGTSGADTVAIGRSARGFVTVTIDGEVRSGDLRDRAAFDRRLSGLRVDRLRSVRLTGDDPLDTVVLNTTLGTAARPARIQSNAVTIAAPMNQAGTLRIEARSITVSADVRADAIVLAASGLLNLEAGGSLTASKSIELKADRLIQTGNLAAPAVSITANVLIRSGTISAPGGAVDLQFTENDVATQNATIDVSGPSSGGSIRIDGGTTGHLFHSGTLLATGTVKGGEIRLSGKDVVWVGGGADVSGGSSGGLIHVGGGWQGSDASMTKARTLKVSPHTSLKADGGFQGGTVVLWSEEETTNLGTISARGAKGGEVEVSSKSSLAHGGAVDVGPGGRFLLDPKNIVIADNVMGGVPMFELVNPTPNVNDSFGTAIVPLSTGNVVVTDPGDDTVATDAGAVYLYNGATGALIATLTGSTASDGVGNVTALNNGNYVVNSFNWDNGSASNAGAVTWGNGTTGVSGVVSAANSLVGSTANDQVGFGGVTALSNGNYVVNSYSWDNGAAIDVGAVTRCSGLTGLTGVVSAANSLVGSTAYDQVGLSVTALSNGNYVVNSYNWDNGGIFNVGAVTWGSGTSGVTGVVSAVNSLIGTAMNDYIGFGGVTALSNGNYVVNSYNWDNGAVIDAGAVTWGSGTAGVAGTVSAANSLVGSTTNDQVGSNGVTALSGGSYVVRSLSWDNGAAFDAGAVTWGSGTVGVAGAVSTANSLVGSTASDQVGSTGVTALTNGNYAVVSPNWDNGAIANAGAVTWGSGTTGVAGTVSSSNSLVGSTANDQVGFGGLAALTNGNYVVSSTNWDNGAIVNAGAVTWGNGTTGTTGAVSASNSLTGSTANDQVGNGGLTALANGNYVVSSTNWDNGAIVNAGAATWGNGTTGTTGAVSASNSLTGSTASDQVSNSGVTALANGNYVVSSTNWDNGAIVNSGAVTWGNGTTGTTGAVSASNSLTGSSASDQVGIGGVTALSNGHYLVRSNSWDNGAIANAGAVTWGSGLSGITGAVSAANSLVGSTANDVVGFGGLTALSNGNFVVRSPNWDNGFTIDTGAATWGNGANGSSLTGLIGGAVSTTNSIVGIGSNGPVVDNVNGTWLIRRSTSGGAVYVGFSTPLPNGVTFAANGGASSNLSPAFVAASLNAGTATAMQANSDITLSNALSVNNPSGNGGTLTLQAGRTVTFNANVATDNGNLTVLANADASTGVVDAQRDAGAGGVTVTTGVTIDAGSGAVSFSTGAAAGLTNRASAGVTIAGTVTAGSVTVATADSGSGSPDVSITGTITATGANGIAVNSAGAVTFGANGFLTSTAARAAIAVTGSSISLRNGLSTTNGNATFTGPVTMAGSFNASIGSGVLAFANGLTIGAQALVVTSTAATTIGGTLSLNGGAILAMGGGIAVDSAGSLTGNGLIAGAVTAAGGLAPGSGASGSGNGLLNLGSGSLTLAATSTVSMNGSSKSAFDRVLAAGVNLAGARLALDLSAATLAAGDSITLIDNVSGSATSGTFTGLAQGAIFTANGQTMQISYTGGDGNDVVVTKVADITASFSVTRSGFLYLVPTDTYRQVITLTNTTPTARRPRTFKFVGLPGEVSIVGGTQSGADWFLNLGDASVPSAGSLGIPVQFVVPSGNSFTYTLEILGG